MSQVTSVANIVKGIVGTQEIVDKKESGWAKKVTDRCNSMARNQREKLGIVTDSKTGELTSKPKISYRYYCYLMENYRNAIKALGYKHHLIDVHVKSFLRKYSGSVDGLSDMLDTSLPIEKLRDNLILLRAKSVTGSEYKSDLLNLKIEHHAYYMFEPRGAVRDWISDDDNKSLTKKLKSQILVNPTWVKKTATRLLTSKNPTVSDLCIGIALATGRRLTEIMKTAEFKEVDNETLLFSGQLKTKNRHLFEDMKPYKISCMIKAETVINALKLLRKETSKDNLRYRDVFGAEIESNISGGDIKDYYHNRAIRKRYESTMNIAMRSLMKNGNFSLKDCRALYTEVTYQDHAAPGESRSAYRHRVLGHSLFETQLHYDSYKIDIDVESVKLFESKEEGTDKAGDKIKEALFAYLSQHDDAINEYRRAPKLAMVHQWLKNEISGSLLHEQIKSSYIRRHCLFDGKQLNLNVIKGYLGEEIKSAYKYVGPTVNLSQFEPPKDEPKKPKNKKEREILELEERIDEIEIRNDEISDERSELDDEKIDLQRRMDEIAEEDEELESELLVIEEEREDSQLQLEELRDELEKEQNDKNSDEKPKSGDLQENKILPWPDLSEIEIIAVKKDKMWHVSVTVNKKTIEILVKGNKRSAIKDFKAHYKKEIKPS